MVRNSPPRKFDGYYAVCYDTEICVERSSVGYGRERSST
jgi:hypothetical protein